MAATRVLNEKVRLSDGHNIRIVRIWESERLKKACEEYGLYKAGEPEDFEKLMDFVDHNPPTTDNIYYAAKDIASHTRYDGVFEDEFYVMHILDDCVVHRHFYNA